MIDWPTAFFLSVAVVAISVAVVRIHGNTRNKNRY